MGRPHPKGPPRPLVLRLHEQWLAGRAARTMGDRIERCPDFDGDADLQRAWRTGWWAQAQEDLAVDDFLQEHGFRP